MRRVFCNLSAKPFCDPPRSAPAACLTASRFNLGMPYGNYLSASSLIHLTAQKRLTGYHRCGFSCETTKTWETVWLSLEVGPCAPLIVRHVITRSAPAWPRLQRAVRLSAWLCGKH